MKISEFLLKEGVFSNEIKVRLKTGQMKLNGESITNDIELDMDSFVDAGDWIFHFISTLSDEKKNIFSVIVNLFDIETIFSGGCKINGKLIEEILPELNVFKKHNFFKTTKKQMYIIKKTN